MHECSTLSLIFNFIKKCLLQYSYNLKLYLSFCDGILHLLEREDRQSPAQLTEYSSSPDTTPIPSSRLWRVMTNKNLANLKEIRSKIKRSPIQILYCNYLLITYSYNSELYSDVLGRPLGYQEKAYHTNCMI